MDVGIFFGGVGGVDGIGGIGRAHKSVGSQGNLVGGLKGRWSSAKWVAFGGVVEVVLGRRVSGRCRHVLGRKTLPNRMPSTGIYWRMEFDDSGHSRARWPGLRHLKQMPLFLKSSRSRSVSGFRGG